MKEVKYQVWGDLANGIHRYSKLVLGDDGQYYLTNPLHYEEQDPPLLDEISVSQEEAEDRASLFHEFGLLKPMRRTEDATFYQSGGTVENPLVRNYVLNKAEEALGAPLPDNATVRNEGATFYTVYSDKPGISLVKVNGKSAPPVDLACMVEDLRREGVTPEIVTL